MKKNPYLNEHLVVVVLSFTLLIVGMILHLAFELYDQAIALVVMGLTIPFGENFILKDETNHPYKKVTRLVDILALILLVIGVVLVFVFKLEVIGVMLAMSTWLLIAGEKYARTQGRYQVSTEHEEQKQE